MDPNFNSRRSIKRTHSGNQLSAWVKLQNQLLSWVHCTIWLKPDISNAKIPPTPSIWCLLMQCDGCVGVLITTRKKPTPHQLDNRSTANVFRVSVKTDQPHNNLDIRSMYITPSSTFKNQALELCTVIDSALGASMVFYGWDGTLIYQTSNGHQALSQERTTQGLSARPPLTNVVTSAVMRWMRPFLICFWQTDPALSPEPQIPRLSSHDFALSDCPLRPAREKSLPWGCLCLGQSHPEETEIWCPRLHKEAAWGGFPKYVSWRDGPISGEPCLTPRNPQSKSTVLC